MDIKEKSIETHLYYIYPGMLDHLVAGGLVCNELSSHFKTF